MYDWIFRYPKKLDRSGLIQASKDLGLDPTRFTADLDGGQFKALVETDIAEGNRLGVEGTPTFFINGQEMMAAPSLDEFKRIVEAELHGASGKQVLSQGLSSTRRMQ